MHRIEEGPLDKRCEVCGLRLPCKAGKPDLLKEEGFTPTEGKKIRMARASLVTVGSEGSHRK